MVELRDFAAHLEQVDDADHDRRQKVRVVEVEFVVVVAVAAVDIARQKHLGYLY